MKKWLDKRYKRQTKLSYLKSSEELKQNAIIEDLFVKFDGDGSGKKLTPGSLDIDEIMELFEQNDIVIDKEFL
jgi:hypothetical protein